jgi:hypothetical protein
MGPNLLLSTLLGSIVVMLVAGCGGSSGTAHGNAGGSAKTTQKTTQPAYYSPRIDPADFTTHIDNKYFPLKPGTTLVYQGKTKDATVGDVVAVTSDTKQIMVWNA